MLEVGRYPPVHSDNILLYGLLLLYLAVSTSHTLIFYALHHSGEIQEAKVALIATHFLLVLRSG